MNAMPQSHFTSEQPLAQAAPPELTSALGWFGKAISRPLVGEMQSQSQGIERPLLADEAELWLRGNELIGPMDRLQVYNRQYWFRLITVMQADYACTIHVMGLRNYNPWVIRYLETYPPDSPFLNHLDHAFVRFMQAAYDGEDRELVLEAMAYDRAFAKAFEGGMGKSLHPDALCGDVMQIRLALAPHVTPLVLGHDWAPYRLKVLDDDSLEMQLPPPEAKVLNCVVHRHDMTLYEKEIEPAAAAMLLALNEPATLPEIFEKLPELPDADMTQLEQHLTEWFSDFVARGWIVSGDAE